MVKKKKPVAKRPTETVEEISVMRNSIYCGGKMTHSMINQMSDSFNFGSSVGFTLGMGNTVLSNRQNEAVLRESEAEFKRRGKFHLIFPCSSSTICVYKNLFQTRDLSNNKESSINYLLHNRFLEKGYFSLQKAQDEELDGQFNI